MADKKTPVEKATSEGSEALVRHWQGQIDKALKREKNYRKEAREFIRIYEGEDETAYNILFSNTETLSPAIYNSSPIPDARPKLKHEEPVALAASGLVNAYLQQFVDSGDSRYCAYDQSCRESLTHGLVPGRGVQRFHYRAEVEYTGDGEARTPSKVLDETVYGEALDWDKVLFGYSKTWVAVPWIAYIHNFTRDAAKEELGAEAASLLTYSFREEEDENATTKKESEGAEETAIVYEIWHKAERKRYFISSGVLKWVKPPEDDPYALQGFYPTQEPLQFFQRISSFLPVPLYRMYRRQARELNRITDRITALIEGMKVRGFYDSSVEGLDKVLESEDNKLIALQMLAQMGQGGKVENSIWLVPIEKHIVVLQQLMVQRQTIKQVIFEIMGIADIMRGASVASETLGAQEIKNKWGVLRLKQAQNRMATFIRDGLRIAAELAFTKLGPDTLRQLTGSTLPAAEELAQLEAQVKQAQMMQAPIPPEAQQKLALPAFEECLDLLKSDIARKFTIDIETNSSIDAEATEDKEAVAEFMGGFSQVLQGIGPLVEQGFMPFDAAKVVLLSIAKKFRLGRELEEQLRKMQPPPQKPGDGKEQQKLMQDQMKLAQERMKLGQDRMKLQLEVMKAKMEQTKAAMQQEMDAEKQKMELEKLMMEIEKLLTQGQMDMDKASMQLQADQQQGEFALDNKAQQVKQAEQQSSMNDQVRTAKFQTKQSVAVQKTKQQQAKAKPAPGR